MPGDDPRAVPDARERAFDNAVVREQRKQQIKAEGLLDSSSRATPEAIHEMRLKQEGEARIKHPILTEVSALHGPKRHLLTLCGGRAAAAAAAAAVWGLAPPAGGSVLPGHEVPRGHHRRDGEAHDGVPCSPCPTTR